MRCRERWRRVIFRRGRIYPNTPQNVPMPQMLRQQAPIFRSCLPPWQIAQLQQAVTKVTPRCARRTDLEPCMPKRQALICRRCVRDVVCFAPVYPPIHYWIKQLPASTDTMHLRPFRLGPFGHTLSNELGCGSLRWPQQQRGWSRRARCGLLRVSRPLWSPSCASCCDHSRYHRCATFIPDLSRRGKLSARMPAIERGVWYPSELLMLFVLYIYLNK